MHKPLSPAELHRLLEAARNGPTLFSRLDNGGVAWELSGSDRCFAYQLIAEAGVLSEELATLTPGDFCLLEDLPRLVLGSFARPARRGLHLPLVGAVAAALTEYLRERTEDEPVFSISDGACTEHALRFDACRTGLSSRRVSAAALEAFYRVKMADAVGTSGKVWTAHAVELRTHRTGEAPGA